MGPMAPHYNACMMHWFISQTCTKACQVILNQICSSEDSHDSSLLRLLKSEFIDKIEGSSLTLLSHTLKKGGDIAIASVCNIFEPRPIDYTSWSHF